MVGRMVGGLVEEFGEYLLIPDCYIVLVSNTIPLRC